MITYALLVFLFAYAHSIHVYTTEGVVKGFHAGDKGDYYAFYGIRYAAPTFGKNRFKGPAPPAQHRDVYIADKTTVFCAQPTAQGMRGTEDCLTLSIFTNNVTTSNITRPVFVWLNTEGYATTNMQFYSYRSFVKEDVVFVNMNFRLSIFGFLCLGVPDAPGNAGLKDIIQGLKWVKSNIANFGGDPNNVVLIGHAAGAAIVDLLTITPQTKKLVHKAIALSGSSLAPWALAYDPVGHAKHLGANLGYQGKTITGLAKYLINADFQPLNTALNNLKYYNNTPLFAPCIENPKLKLNDTILFEPPINVIRSGKYNQIPFIYGYTSRDVTVRAGEAASKKWKDDVKANFSNLLPVDLQLNKNKTTIESLRNLYFKNITIDNFLTYERDIEIIVPVTRAAKERATTSKSAVRLLEFGYVGANFNKSKHMTVTKHDAFMNYLFDYDLRSVDEVVSKSIVRRFVGFAQNGNPVANFSGNSTVAWPPVTKNNTIVFSYTNNPIFKQFNANKDNNITISVEKITNAENVTSFWIPLYDKYYVPPLPQYSNSATATLSCVVFVMLCQLLIGWL